LAVNWDTTDINWVRDNQAMRAKGVFRGFAHGFLVLSYTAEFCYKCDDFYHANDEGGLAWNDPEIGIEWPQLVGEYKGTASAEGYTLRDGTKLNLSEKDQKWAGLKDTFVFK
jgi:dTDP-4-dehydrorhamnose 3,5-epimerase